MSEKIYDFMHKEIKLASLALDEMNRVTDVWDVKKSIFFPVYENMGVSTDDFISWFNSRSVPVSRMENEAERNLAVFNSMGLSLTDCYWFKPEGSDKKWDEVNFYKNGFSEDVGINFFNRQPINSSSSSPDFSLNGELEKRWKYVDKRPVLLKRGKNPYQKEPFCEKIASDLAKAMGLAHVTYDIGEDDRGYYSICEAFTDEKNELVNAKNFIRTLKYIDEKTDFERFTDKCKENGIEDIAFITDNMIVFDYLMLNVDRHWGNFGVIRDSDSGRIKGMAPIFDTGMSLSREYGLVFDKVQDSGFNNLMLNVDMNRSLEYVKNFAHINLTGLDDFGNHIASVFLSNKNMRENDIRDIVDCFRERVQKVKMLQE